MYCKYCGKNLNKDNKCLECDKKNNNSLKDTSNVLGIISFIMSFIFLIISIPVAIVSIIKGNEYFKNTKEKCVGKSFAIASIAISIIKFLLLVILIVFLGLFIYSGKTYNEINSVKTEEVEKSFDRNTFNGVWMSSITAGSYEFDTNNNTYKMFNSNNHNDNYCEGDISFLADSKYYDEYIFSIGLNPKKCIINGKETSYENNEMYEIFKAKFNLKNDRQMTLTNSSSRSVILKKKK